ncbi:MULTISPECIES: DJ-1/PfpI family protein [unclassified Methylophilus]|uniref:DJ-1/PfpI family protein n=1 Tax=unclassified Methylophilus TaxID=2630143 RepID=UPI00037E1E3A|nr:MULTISPECIES: DJ-1/PfpI family protein [unclassified Methylophilus]
MHIAILTFDGFNELDSMIALGILNRVQQPGWRVSIASPTARVTSMNGVALESHISLAEASAADAVIIGSGIHTRAIAESAMLASLHLDPDRQLIGAQCSGALILAKLGLLNGLPACTDLVTKPWVQALGVDTLDQPFFARGNIATAGGCLASQYLAFWLIARQAGLEAAQKALHDVAPVGEKEHYLASAASHVRPYLPEALLI